MTLGKSLALAEPVLGGENEVSGQRGVRRAGLLGPGQALLHCPLQTRTFRWSFAVALGWGPPASNSGSATGGPGGCGVSLASPGASFSLFVKAERVIATPRVAVRSK